MHPDFLIIGGGVIGFMTALELSRRGATVSIVERGVTGQEASWAGGGILSPLLPWDYADAVTQLTAPAAARYATLTEELLATTGIDAEYHPGGMLVLPPYETSRARQWASRHAAPVAEVSARSQAARIGADTHALWLPAIAQLRNPRLLKALRRQLDANGVTLREKTEVLNLTIRRAHAASVRTSRGDIHAGGYIVTAGSWSQSLLDVQQKHTGFRPIRGQMLLLKAERPLFQPVIIQRGVYLIPRRDGHILVGSTLEDVGFDKSTTAEALTTLHARAADILPVLADMPVVRHWAGLRPGSPGNIPAISRLPGVDNVYLNSGHFRYGVTMAPASAQLVCDLVLGQLSPIDPTPYQWHSPAIEKNSANRLN